MESRGIEAIGGVHFMAQYTDFIDTITYNYFAIGMPVGKKAAAGWGTRWSPRARRRRSRSWVSPRAAKIGMSYMEVDLGFAYNSGTTTNIGLTAKYLTRIGEFRG
jgi:hypothetical protein